MSERKKDFDKFEERIANLRFLVNERVSAQQQAQRLVAAGFFELHNGAQRIVRFVEEKGSDGTVCLKCIVAVDEGGERAMSLEQLKHLTYSIEGQVVVCLNEVALLTSSNGSGGEISASLPPPHTATAEERRRIVGSLQRNAAERDPSYVSMPAERLDRSVEAVLATLFEAKIPCVVFSEYVSRFYFA